MSSREKRSQYWNHFTDESQRSFRPKKITDIRLKQIKNAVFDDDYFWQKVVAGRDALNEMPDELKESSPSDYERTRANFWSLIREKISASIGKNKFGKLKIR